MVQNYIARSYSPLWQDEQVEASDSIKIRLRTRIRVPRQPGSRGHRRVGEVSLTHDYSLTVVSGQLDPKTEQRDRPRHAHFALNVPSERVSKR